MSIMTLPPAATKQNSADNSISDFFSAFSLPSARNHLRKLMLVAMEPAACRYHPSRVLWFYESLGSLLMAALAIEYSGMKNTEAVLEPGSGNPDPLQYGLYCGGQKKILPWHYLPRFLSEKEYINPYLVFEKLAAYGGTEQWQAVLKELRDFSFSVSSFAEIGDDYNILRIFLLLNKLLEAAHLIVVRQGRRIESQPTPE